MRGAIGRLQGHLRRSGAAGLLAVAVWGAPATGRAEDREPLTGVSLTVSRSQSAGDCPTAAELRQAVASRGGTAPEAPVQLEVHFDRDSAYFAHVQATGARSGRRLLRIEDAHCAALLDVVAVALALLLDPNLIENQPTLPPPEDSDRGDATGRGPPREPGDRSGSARTLTPTESSRAPHRTSVPAPAGAAQVSLVARAHPHRPATVALRFVPVAAYGMTPHTVALGAEGQASWRRGPVSFRLGPTGLLPRTQNVAGGSVEGHLVGGRAALCYEQRLGNRFGLATCGTLLGGALDVRGQGYPNPEPRSLRPLWALGTQLELAGQLSPRWGYVLQWVPVVPLRRERFYVAVESATAVERVTAFQTAWVSGWLGAGIWLRLFPPPRTAQNPT